MGSGFNTDNTMVSVFLYFVLVHSGTVLSSSFILPLFFFRLPLYHKKEALSEGHPELMQRIITENIPHREHKHIVQISRRCYAMIEVQSHFFSPSIPYDTTSERVHVKPCLMFNPTGST